MNTDQIKELVTDSNILTDEERAYWLASLPKMNEQQLTKLEGILLKAAKIPWTEQVEKYFALIAKSATLLTAGAI